MSKKALKPQNEKSVIINRIDVRPIRRSSQDVQTWRNALISAESTQKNRQLLYDLYEDIILDTHLESVIGKRQDALINSRLTFTRDGVEDEEIINILNSPDMSELLVDMLDHKFWGYSLAEITGINLNPVTEMYEIAYDLIPRKHVKPEFGIVGRLPSDSTGIPYKDIPYCVWAGRKDNFGLLLKVAFWVIIKRGDVSDWAQFAEVFGMPFREFRYRGNDDATRVELEKVAEAYAGMGFALIPEEAGFQLHQTTSAASSNVVYKDLAEFCDHQISKAIVGQTMTTDDGSSRSQSETHAEVEDAKKKADRKFVTDFLNTHFKRVLINYGFNASGGKFSFVDSTRLSDLKTRLEIDKVVDEKVPLGDDYWYETYGINKPTNYNQLVAERKERREQEQFGGFNQPFTHEPEPEPGSNKKTNLLQRLFFLNPYKRDSSRLYDYLNVQTQFIASQPEKTLTAAEESLIADFNASRVYDPETYRETINKLSSAIFETIGQEHGYATEHSVMSTLMELNINRFGYDKNCATILELNRAFNATGNAHNFRKEAKRILGRFNGNYLDTEYTVAVATAQNASAWAQQKQEQAIFPYLMYKTAGDEHVRHSHKALDGKIFKVSDHKEWGAVYPPNGWRCRCEMVQVTSDEARRKELISGKQAKEVLGDEWKDMEKHGFAVNRGETKEVFELNKAYINMLPGKKRPEVNFVDAGLKTLSEIRSTFVLDNIPLADVTPETVIRQAQSQYTTIDNKQWLVLSDYNKRKVGIDLKSLEKHLGTDYTTDDENRHRIFHLIGNTLTDPDEVYLRTRSNKNQYRYIKIYNDRLMVVDCDITKDYGMQIKTWYMDKKAEGELREGILLKKGRF